MDTWESHVLPHGDLIEVLPGFWQVTGRLARGNMPRNMVVYRVPASGGLVIHSGIALDEPQVKNLEALGSPEVLIVPNRFHRLDALVFKQRYPKVRVVCPAAARSYVEQKVPVDDTCEHELAKFGITISEPAGIKPSELCYEFPVAGGKALVVTDLLFNLPNLPGLDGMIFRLIGSTGFFGITRIGRFLMLQDRGAFKAWLEKMAALPGLKGVFVGHGDAVLSDAGQRLKQAAARL